MITNQEADILAHTSSNGRYVSDEALAISLGERGLLYDHGPQALAAGAHYLLMTVAGRSALNEWRAAQPKPPKPKRRTRPEFQGWRDYTEATGARMGFSEFLKQVWPRRNEYLYRP